MTRTPQPASDSASCASRIRWRSGLAALLFLPALFVAKILMLATDKGGRCFVNDTDCAPFPVAAFGALLAAVVVSLVVATAAPARVGRVALAVQLSLELVAVTLVLGFP
ncbi:MULTISPECIES: hypothetical protein [Streptomyces]|uniref:hypothetical protein n=1 Tax=Streptomyces TaxID=1883 RepID=UPI0004C53DB3|nr:hypothetical protein [Streptomyces sp. NRRL S-237]